MIYLLIASLIWAFSFGLIKHNLVAPGLDLNFLAFARLAISFCIFVPFMKLKGLQRGIIIKFMFLGGIQYGMMYIFYLNSFHFLESYQVAVFTIFTPLFVTLINDLYIKKFRKLFLFTASLSVLGTGIIIGSTLNIAGAITGFILLQLSNLCFAYGQVRYRMIMGVENYQPETVESGRIELRNRDVFGFMYLGGVICASIPAMATTNWSTLNLTFQQGITLLYLGILPSGVCFYLWNIGARKTNSGTLAVLNNAKVPLAVICSLVIWQESANLINLLIGGLIIAAAVYTNERHNKSG